VRWPADQRLVYALSWSAKTSGEVAPGKNGEAKSTELSLESSVEGEITLQLAGRAAGMAQVALTLSRLDKLSFGMDGHATAGDPAAARGLLGQTAFLSIDDRGRVQSVAFPPQMAADARLALRSIALELGYTLPEVDEDTWEAEEADALGQARMRYRAAGNELAREPISFTALDAVPGALDGAQRISGGALLGLDAAGLPLSIEETIDAAYTRKGGTMPAIHSTWTFTLRRTGQATASSAALAAAVLQATARPLRAAIEDPDRDHRRDVRMSREMTLGKVLDIVGEYESGARPDHEFLVRAAAFLRLHPEAIGAVVSRFRDPGLTVRGRGFILDVLVETGSGPAQKGMREALQLPQASEKRTDFGMLVQRFTFVREPDAESVAFLEKTYEADKRNADPSAAQGTAVALGAVVKHLAAMHQDAAAREVNERLRAELRGAPGPALRAALVSALGNAARPEDVADISAVAGDPDGRVRNEAAHALRSVDSEQARQTLLSLAADSSAAVATQALGSLSQQSLGDSDWSALSDLAASGKTPSSSDPALLNLVRSRNPPSDQSRRILTALLARNRGGDNDLPVIIRGLLAKDAGD
jgi:hypothetical protein